MPRFPQSVIDAALKQEQERERCGNFTIAPCSKCLQMTNHYQGVCQKCVKPEQKEANKTECDVKVLLKFIGDCVAESEFEDNIFRLANGHKYTPDWCSPRCVVEAKSEFIRDRGSRIMFDQARLEHPEIIFVWARKRTVGRKGKRWEIEVYNA